MNIDEIEKLVRIVENTTDSEVKKILKDHLAATLRPPLINPVKDAWEQLPYYGCSVCGLGSSGMTSGYVCPRGDCPVRITTTCSSR